jgi:hypothetical protein
LLWAVPSDAARPDARRSRSNPKDLTVAVVMESNRIVESIDLFNIAESMAFGGTGQ